MTPRSSRLHTWSMCDEIAAELMTGVSPAAVCARYGLDRVELARLVGTPGAPAALCW